MEGQLVNWKLELTLKFCNLLILKVHGTFNSWKLKLELTIILRLLIIILYKMFMLEDIYSIV